MVVYLGLLTNLLVMRVRDLREGEKRDLGASALEWAIIAAIAVIIASVIGAVIYNVVQDKGNNLKNCADQPVDAPCGTNK